MSDKPEIWKCTSCGGELDISGTGFYAEVECPHCGARAHVHTQLANFQLLGVLGIGGMSIVFKAKDLILNRPIAIKVLNDTYKDQPERIARFENECAMMAKVRHENVVSVYSAGWARGQFYIAMEHIKGRDLEHIVRKSRKKPLAPAEALDVTREVVYGLQAAGQAGLLHRDMKPGNVLISQTDGRAKMLDFGLSLGNQTEDTEEVIWATPFYVAPETLMREKEDVRTDIYALGMTLRFLLTGVDKLPQQFTSITDLLQAKKKLPSFSSQLPDADPALCDLVEHMTAFNPADRPLNYKELLLELAEVRTILHERELANSPEQVRKRRAFWMGGIGLTLLAGAVGAGFTVGLSVPPPVHETLAVDPMTDLGDLTLMDDALTAVQNTNWTAVNGDLGKLSDNAQESTMAAMAALLRYYMAITDDDDDAAAEYLEAFHNHLQREDDCSPAGRQLFSQLKLVDASLHLPERGSNMDGINRPILKAILYASHAEVSAGRSLYDAKEDINNAKRYFGEAHERFGKLERRLFGLQDRLPQFAKDGSFKNVHAAMLAHDFSSSRSSLINLGSMELSPEEMKRLAVLKEIQDVAEAMVQLLQSKLPDDYRPGMQPAAMRSAAAKLNVPELDKEVFSLGLLMKGDYKSAFENNPYREEANSNKPFAVLMRHWQKDLGMGGPAASAGAAVAERKPARRATPSAPSSSSTSEESQEQAVQRSVTDNEWDQELYNAALKNSLNLDACRELIQSGSNVNNREIYDDNRLFHRMGTTPALFEVFMEGGYSPNLQSKYGWALIHFAKEESVLNRLLEAGADVNIASRNGSTPIFRVFNGEQFVATLLEHGARANWRDSIGETPLHAAAIYCAKHNMVPIMRRLLEAGADLNAVSKGGKTPLDVCLESQNGKGDAAAALKFLQSQGAKRANELK